MMKKRYALFPLISMMFFSTAILAKTGSCTLNLVKEDGNFQPSDYGPGGMVTYNVTMPYTDGYYPNQWTSTQPKPRVPFSNCITYQGAPSNAKITSINYTYTYHQAVLVADYQIQLGFLGTSNKYSLETITGGGIRNGSGIPLNGSGSYSGVNNKRLSEMDMQLRVQVTNPAVSANCNKYIPRDECRTKNTRLTQFTVIVGWSS